MREVLLEIWSSIRKNKLRTFLTGFSVAWGILMLIILLSSGNGLQRGALSNFDFMDINSIEITGGRTSIPYAGYDKGRRINFSNSDLDMIKNEFPEVDEIIAGARYARGRLTYGDQFQNVSMTGVTANYRSIIKLDVLEGRFINEQDVRERRKVIVVEEGTRDVLFGGESPIGKTVIERGILYTVVGVYKMHDYGNSSNNFIPISTGQLIYAQNDPWIRYILLTVNGITTEKHMEDFETRLYGRLAAEHHFDPNDKNALWVSNYFTMYKTINRVFGGISLFIWIIGLGTLLAGIVGVSNIMLVTVRERTFEFGIRKALGAKPASIIRLILIESVLITSFFGYIGLVLGAGIMEVVSYFVDMSAQNNPGRMTMFMDPTLDLRAAVMAVIVLVIAGLIAGYVPARRAARLKTIDAMRHNK